MSPAGENGDRGALGSFIRVQRKLANLSLRQMADLAEISNPYLSQVERGLHEPSVHVLRSIARALNVSSESLLEQAGLLTRDEDRGKEQATEAAIRSDSRLTEDQRLALLAVHRSYVLGNAAASAGGNAAGSAGPMSDPQGFAEDLDVPTPGAADRPGPVRPARRRRSTDGAF